MFYKIIPGFINKTVGNIASDAMTPDYKGYNSDNSVYRLTSIGEIQFSPDFNSVQILSKARPMDIIRSVPIATSALIISDRLLDFILQFNVPSQRQIFDVNALYKGKSLKYNYFYLYQPTTDFIDFQSMRFFESKFGELGSEVSLDGVNQFNALDEKTKWSIKPEKLILKEREIQYDIFNLHWFGFGYLVSERMKKAMEKERFDGLAFESVC